MPTLFPPEKPRLYPVLISLSLKLSTLSFKYSSMASTSSALELLSITVTETLGYKLFFKDQRQSSVSAELLY